MLKTGRVCRGIATNTHTNKFPRTHLELSPKIKKYKSVCGGTSCHAKQSPTQSYLTKSMKKRKKNEKSV